MPKPTRKSGPHSQDTCPLAIAWMFKLMLDCSGHRGFINHCCFSDDDVARELGVYWLIEDDDSDDEDAVPVPVFLTHRSGPSKKARKPSFHERTLAALRAERKLFDKAFPNPSLPDNLQANLENLARLIGLDEIEQKLIGFCSLMNTDTLLDDCCNQLGYIGFNRLTRILSILLDVPQNDIRVRLSAEGRLVQSGLIETNLRSSARNHLSDLLGFNNKDLLFSVRHHQGSAIGLFQSAFRPAPDSVLRADDFTHLSVPLSIARPYLQQVLEEKKLGVNILIYGPPGTGKSQLTRMLANELCAELYEIACTDNNGDPIDRRGRLCALRSAMCVLGQQKTLLVLDEIEDLFSGSSELAMLAGQERQKGWINRMLEENPIPCFWLTNNIHALDNAYIRRFDLVLRLENPPRRQRENIIRSASHNRLSQPLIDKLANHEQLMPAVITRAMSVASIQDQTNATNLDTTVEFLVNATLQAQGFPRLGQGRMQTLPAFYSPELANTDVPLDQLLGGLRNHGEARLCFYGPPGTGKTAFGHWLAQQLGKPLLTRRASDLISPYVGMTEQNFARAFEQANDDDAILLLDEVDSFLQDRRNARHSWEISAVNEMLTQMESYRGLFIASTNLMDNLDEAALRRFDLKISFGYLTAEQITQLLRQHLHQMGLKKPDSLKLARLLRQSCLTPGDFALVARRARFNPFTDANQVIDALLAESSLKSASNMRAIGFAEW